MIYRIVRMGEDQRMAVVEFDDQQVNIVEELQKLGHEYRGQETRRHLREELFGRPRFGGLVGPMWDGDAIRYEDSETNKILSM